jgi:uracil-DNA glycosylase family protein
MPKPANVPDSAEALIPEKPSLPKLRDAASHCTACDLYKNATQTVFGEGSSRAKMMLIGEQPGDKEDLLGHPFVGPAGHLLEAALEEAGIRRADTYITNIVKHFKWEPRGKRRLHKKPNAAEMKACRPWLDAELALVRPRIIVCLGATAAQTLLGKSFRVTQERGRLIDFGPQPGMRILATVHPSSILRAPDEANRRAELQRFIADLGIAGRAL